jgi:hypothetical protein
MAINAKLYDENTAYPLFDWNDSVSPSSNPVGKIGSEYLTNVNDGNRL